ncbi:hypothetical protein BD410DRAFT_827106 [Rickenella mellea]|uniref:RING-type domain-containing protein n=1 Tax=Rickenella mellea TaxID=50990 RepID=A0A4Y7QAA0_9AGAM|nr:hypothetical protein BD410DRAFT_827106 [Rickenella mellea]
MSRPSSASASVPGSPLPKALARASSAPSATPGDENHGVRVPPQKHQQHEQQNLPVTPQRLSANHNTRFAKQLRSISSPLTPLRTSTNTNTNTNNSNTPNSTTASSGKTTMSGNGNNTRKNTRTSSVTSSPFTPLTNVSSNPGLTSSTMLDSPGFDTPSSASSGTRVDFSSPDSARVKSVSVADCAGNWRVRAKENGIRVKSLGSDEENGTFTIAKDTLPPPFLSTHRRPRQALFQTKSSDITSLTSPGYARRVSAPGFLSDTDSENTAYTVEDAYHMHPTNGELALTGPFDFDLIHAYDQQNADDSIEGVEMREIRRSFGDVRLCLPGGVGDLEMDIDVGRERAMRGDKSALMSTLNTPSPRAREEIVRRMRARGSLTDPARTRRRVPFGANEVLFDIDEQTTAGADYSPYSPYLQVQGTGSRGRATKDREEQPDLGFGSPISLVRQGRGLGLGQGRARAVSEGGELMRFQLDFGRRMSRTMEFAVGGDGIGVGGDEGEGADEGEMSPGSTKVSATSKEFASLSGSPSSTTTNSQSPTSTSTPPTTNAAQSCALCNTPSTLSALSSLVPCAHVVCSSCLTGALNIVGEKDLRCVVCEEVVRDFRMLGGFGRGAAAAVKDTQTQTKEGEEGEKINEGQEKWDEEMEEGNGEKERGELKGEEKEKMSYKDAVLPKVVPAPAPAAPVVVEAKKGDVDVKATDELAVLRIDNVPWDITPPRLVAFFAPHPVVRAHVLLDPRGKTLSHAYVEVPEASVGEALRGVRGKSLGDGRRRRGVTVTRGRRGDVGRALFPSWKGTFDGDKPSLEGLDNERVGQALEEGLIGLSELDALITLMRKPDSHFLKVPSLPFYWLVSILSKFPADVDSRVFWSATLRDLLHEITFAACQILISKMETKEHDQYLLEQLVQAGVACQAFTDQQRLSIVDLVDACVTFPSTAVSDIRVNGNGNRDMASPPPPTEGSCGSMTTGTTMSLRMMLEGREEVRTPESFVDTGAGAGGMRLLPAYPFHASAAYMRTPTAAPMTGFQTNAHTHRQPYFPVLQRQQPQQPQQHQPQQHQVLHAHAHAHHHHQGAYIQNVVPGRPGREGGNPYDVLAAEFGVEEGLVHALAQRLAISGMVANARARAGTA